MEDKILIALVSLYVIFFLSDSMSFTITYCTYHVFGGEKDIFHPDFITFLPQFDLLSLWCCMYIQISNNCIRFIYFLFFCNVQSRCTSTKRVVKNKPNILLSLICTIHIYLNCTPWCWLIDNRDFSLPLFSHTYSRLFLLILFSNMALQCGCCCYCYSRLCDLANESTRFIPTQQQQEKATAARSGLDLSLRAAEETGRPAGSGWPDSSFLKERRLVLRPRRRQQQPELVPSYD